MKRENERARQYANRVWQRWWGPQFPEAEIVRAYVAGYRAARRQGKKGRKT